MIAFQHSKTTNELVEMGIAPIARTYWLEKSLPITSKSAEEAVPAEMMSKKKKKKVRMHPPKDQLQSFQSVSSCTAKILPEMLSVMNRQLGF